MSPAEHDAALAATSHLPHVVALRWPPRHRNICSPWRRAVGGIQRGWPAATRSCGDRSSRRNREQCSRRSIDLNSRSASCVTHLSAGDDERLWKFSNRQGRLNRIAMLWEIDIHPAEGQPDRAASAWRRRRASLDWPTTSRGRSARLSGSGRIAGSADSRTAGRRVAGRSCRRTAGDWASW